MEDDLTQMAAELGPEVEDAARALFRQVLDGQNFAAELGNFLWSLPYGDAAAPVHVDEGATDDPNAYEDQFSTPASDTDPFDEGNGSAFESGEYQDEPEFASAPATRRGAPDPFERDDPHGRRPAARAPARAPASRQAPRAQQVRAAPAKPASRPQPKQTRAPAKPAPRAPAKPPRRGR